ncbi:hypothetical protein [Novosphingobium taihuense]|uniref:Uncharacterized protein n=1 Tax=Novosphingobium taihuense TaxID=260085 RepID=A0A7W7ACH2_9SPHN|nr:hypothetical protein [Novosphingobium taihuense]MBB4613632.1 hypothetical protein [Novosphingobium taihuense]
MKFTKALRFATIMPCTLVVAAPLSAQTAVSEEKVTAGDVVTKPLSDFNIKKDEVPDVLVAARNKPYDMSGLKKCPAIAAEVTKLDAVLGDDIDVARDDGNSTIKMGNIAKSLVSSLIPFGGVIREISGANAQQRKWNEAIYAGSVRRAYLKGMGEQRGCKYPARSATPKDVSTLWAAREAAEANAKSERKKDDDKKDSKDKSAKSEPARFESKPVVQRTQ